MNDFIPFTNEGRGEKMKLVNGFDLMQYAKEKGYILPAFNTTDMEMTYAIAQGLSDAGLPGYIQISSNNLRLSNPKMIAELAADAVRSYDIPVALHLDHGKSFDHVKACVEAGFTSVMIDASHLAYEENIAEVRKAVEYCHFYGIPVEAELGALRGKEEDILHESDAKTDPELVEEFVRRSGCDLLAVSVGNVHGLSIQPDIDLPLLKQISEIAEVPLVLHGGSGIPAEMIRAVRQYGVLKINYGSDLRKEMIRSFGEAYEKDHNAHDVISLSLQAVENVRVKTAELVKMVNCQVSA